jgi:L-lactate utilization protein LutB
VLVGISQMRKNNVERTKTELEVSQMQSARTIEEQVQAANRLVTDLDEILRSLNQRAARRGGQVLAVLGFS